MPIENCLPIATKDCRTCIRRRIKCDRGLPSCQKCSGRSLECPGYGILLRWDQGAAIRRRGRRRSISQIGEQFTLAQAHETLVINDSRRSSLSSAASSSYINLDASSPHGCEEMPASVEAEFLLSMHPGSMLETLQSPLIRRLLHHYDTFLAPQLAWVDSFENPWRNIILPMAQESPSLLSSILASAAGDLARRHITGTPFHEEKQKCFDHYRDQALALSAEEMKQHAFHSADHAPANSILAGVFLLCYHEMKFPQSGLWLLHLRAVRSLLTCWAQNATTSSTPGSTRTFLMQEFFAINAVTDITSFASTPSSMFEIDLVPPDDNEAIFMGFLRVIRSITQNNRCQLAHSSLNRPLDLHTLRAKLHAAQSHARSCRQSLAIRTLQAKRDFDHVINTFHYSTLLYGYQMLPRSHSTSSLIIEASEELFFSLRDIRDMHPFAQEMAWPVFILGTDCPPSNVAGARQCVEDRMAEIMLINGPLQRREMMDFLKEWWKLCPDEREAITWIEFARGRANQGHTFLVL